MITLDREYSSKGVLSAGSGLFVKDDTLTGGLNEKFVLLVPTSDMPAGPSAPEGIDNPILTVSKNGQVEGKQSVEQKEYTINWNRDNLLRLKKFAGKECEFMERHGMEMTGYWFKGTISFSNDAFSDNEIMAGKIYVTVTEDLGYVDDVRDFIAYTTIITSALPRRTIASNGTSTFTVKTIPGSATVTASSNSDSATVAVTGKSVTVTGASAGTAIITLTAQATGEAPCERTFLVDVTE